MIELYEKLEYKKARLKELQKMIKKLTNDGIDQKDIAKFMGKDESTLTKIMQGKIKKLSTIENYIKLLNK